jgi:hypothetical protein
MFHLVLHFSLRYNLTVTLTLINLLNRAFCSLEMLLLAQLRRRNFGKWAGAVWTPKSSFHRYYCVNLYVSDGKLRINRWNEKRRMFYYWSPANIHMYPEKDESRDSRVTRKLSINSWKQLLPPHLSTSAISSKEPADRQKKFLAIQKFFFQSCKFG